MLSVISHFIEYIFQFKNREDIVEMDITIDNLVVSKLSTFEINKVLFFLFYNPLVQGHFFKWIFAWNFLDCSNK
jgi:hypothetical protein